MLSNLAVIKMNDCSVSTFACPPSVALIAIILLRQALAPFSSTPGTGFKLPSDWIMMALVPSGISFGMW